MDTSLHNDGTTRRVVNLISETVDGCKGHGVHTAFLQTRDALRRANVDVRINSSEPADVMHIQTMGLRSLGHMLGAHEPIVLAAHIVPESLVGSFILASVWLPIGTWYMRLFYNLADEVLAVSPEVVDGLGRMQLSVPVRLVPNAVEVRRFQPQPGWRAQIRERAGVDPDAFVAICVGQIQPRKGLDAFIETARNMPDVTFVWVGGMPFQRLTDHYRQMMRTVADAPANCRFVGDTPYDEVPQWYAAADCLFFPSRQETFGLAVIEAAAAGLPLVLRDLSTYRPLFDDSYLAGDDESFAQVIASVRDDADLRGSYQKRARAIAARFDADRLAERLLGVYTEVMERAETERERSPRRWRPMLQWAFTDWRRRR